MSMNLLFNQLLNGLQLGVLLFLVAAGLTLVFGIMGFVNLAHGALYMLGAYVAATTYSSTGSFVLAVIVAAVATLVLGLVLERLAVSRLYSRNPLDHVLATFGMVLFFNELARIVWGPQPLFVKTPAALDGTVHILGFDYPTYRLFIIAVGLVVALAFWLLIQKTRIGMLVRAGAQNPDMVGALGVNVRLLKALLFAAGAMLAGLAGAVAAPVLSVQAGMGDSMLITALVVIVVGGIGSVSGAFYAALVVGLVDTFGRAVLPSLLKQVLERSIADTAAPALASMSIYLVMAVVLTFRPQGLFPPKAGA